MTRAFGGFTVDGVAMSRIEAYTFSVTGNVAVAAGKSRIYLEGSYVVDTIRAAVGTAPTGSSILVDVNKNGVSLFTTQANRPAIASGANSGTSNNPDITTFVANDYLTVDVDQVGSTVAGADLTVTVRLRKTP